MARRQRSQRAYARLAGVAIVFLLLIVVAVVWHGRKAAPSPQAWDLLAKELLSDEFAGDSQWNPVLMSKTTTPRSPPRVTAQLRASVTGLSGHWFGRNWNGLPRGRLPALKAAAVAYDQAYEHAHAWTRITSAYDGRGLPVAETITAPSEPPAMLARLAQLNADLKAAAAPWSQARSSPGGSVYADRIRALLAAHARLLASETTLVRFVADHPSAWATAAVPGESVLFDARDTGFLDQSRDLIANRAQAVANLRQAEANAQQP